MYKAMNKYDLLYLKKAIKIAKDNPDGNKSVGCVIVKNGKIISTGYRKTFIICNNPYIDITFHAEHIALLKAGKKAAGATLYTTLEPCTVRCKYPGDVHTCCSDFIIRSKIKKVVIAEIDNDFGKGGIKKLEKHGIKTLLWEK